MVEFVLITGAIKTGTSTVTAITNADPESHIMYEIDFARPPGEGRNAELTEAYPDVAPLFSAPPHYSIRDKLAQVLDLNPKFRRNFPKIFGVKLPGLPVKKMESIKDLHTIATFRDIRTWLCKNRIIDNFHEQDANKNIVATAIDYTDSLIESFSLPIALRLRLEEISLNEGNFWPKRISDFLGLNAVDTFNWWDNKPRIQASASYSNWTHFHASSFLKPEVQDTVVALKSHPFWDAFLPIFDKYYSAPDGRFSADEIRGDRQVLNSMRTKFTMSLADGYSSFSSFKIGGISQGLGSGEVLVEALGMRTLQELIRNEARKD